MRDKNWMKFAASGRVDDYLAYCKNCQNRYPSVEDDRSEDEDVDESECYPDRDGFEFHARG